MCAALGRRMAAAVAAILFPAAARPARAAGHRTLSAHTSSARVHTKNQRAHMHAAQKRSNRMLAPAPKTHTHGRGTAPGRPQLPAQPPRRRPRRKRPAPNAWLASICCLLCCASAAAAALLLAMPSAFERDPGFSRETLFGEDYHERNNTSKYLSNYRIKYIYAKESTYHYKNQTSIIHRSSSHHRPWHKPCSSDTHLSARR